MNQNIFPDFFTPNICQLKKKTLTLHKPTN